VPVVDGRDALEHRAHRPHDGLAPVLGDIPFGHLEVRVLGEDLRELVPVLGVQRPEVAGLQALDVLDVDQPLEQLTLVHHERSIRSNAASIASRRWL
jgi:hypothetical protein